MIGRRGFITGLVSLIATPVIVRVASIMPVKVMEPEWVERAMLAWAERQINPPWFDDMGAFGMAITYLPHEVPLRHIPLRELFDEQLARM